MSEFTRLLGQETVHENLVLTGLRGVGKTVLLEHLKPLAIQNDWLWIGTDLSESASVDEPSLAIRLMTDLAVVTSNIIIHVEELPKFGLRREVERVEHMLDFAALSYIYEKTPGLVSDKVKAVLSTAARIVQALKKRGLIFAYDEAQNLADHSPKDQYPLSLLLDIFQSIQRTGIPFMLVLTGLPTLFPKLVEARTFAERMFRVVLVDHLNGEESREAITRPIQKEGCPVHFTDESVETIIKISGGYPYFIQFICRECYDVFMQRTDVGEASPAVPVDAITRKLDSDFFAGRWARATDRQRDLLGMIARLENCDSEFTVQEIVEMSRRSLAKPFSGSHVNQMLVSLAEAGIVYKNRHGRYSFAVPLLGRFINRQWKLLNRDEPNLFE